MDKSAQDEILGMNFYVVGRGNALENVENDFPYAFLCELFYPSKSED